MSNDESTDDYSPAKTVTLIEVACLSQNVENMSSPTPNGLIDVAISTCSLRGVPLVVMRVVIYDHVPKIPQRAVLLK